MNNPAGKPITVTFVEDYDLFEVLPNGSLIWRGAIPGRENAILKLKELAALTDNEMRVMHLQSQTVTATMNPRKA